jgi:hypothetical protein
MKKALVIFPVFILSFLTMTAQKGNIEFGVKLGPNFSTWVGEDAEPFGDEEKKMKIGVHGGFFAIVPISTMLAFQPELLFSTGGVVYKENDFKVIYSTSNLNIPLTLRIQTNSGFYAIVGPQLGFQLGGKYKEKDDDEEFEEDLEDLKGFVFSGVIGAGYRSSSGFGAYLRVERGFTSIFDFEDSKVFNSAIMLSLFYMLNWKK